MFQFTHPWGCDKVGKTWSGPLPVSIHAPVRVRRSNWPFLMEVLCFNSRTREGATKYRRLKNQSELFQFTHPWGCDKVRGNFKTSTVCFNSRTREGATFLNSNRILNNNVSIHAPVRVRLYVISGRGKRNVSIHAPVRVRPFFNLDSITIRCFNSRTREGATYFPICQKNQNQFQFTHPWGCDQKNYCIIETKNSFNSRTREGATGGIRFLASGDRVSIHAPVRVRPTRDSSNSLIFVSIHAPVRVRHYII